MERCHGTPGRPNYRRDWSDGTYTWRSLEHDPAGAMSGTKCPGCLDCLCGDGRPVDSSGKHSDLGVGLGTKCSGELCGKPAGRREGHKALRWNPKLQVMETYDPNPSSEQPGPKAVECAKAVVEHIHGCIANLDGDEIGPVAKQIQAVMNEAASFWNSRYDDSQEDLFLVDGRQSERIKVLVAALRRLDPRDPDVSWWRGDPRNYCMYCTTLIGDEGPHKPDCAVAQVEQALYPTS